MTHMIDTLHHFFNMNGYGVYIFSAYAIVFFLLGVQWYQSWRKSK